jgi:UPF0716 protein FxsA
VIAKLTLLFTVVTVVELTILIPLGQALGTLPTVALVLGTAVLGGTLAKQQGLAIWRRIQKQLANGQLPSDSLLDGLAVIVAGAFLMTPGVLTDVAGISLLIPVLRSPLKSWLKTHVQDMLDGSSVTFIESRSFSSANFENPYESERNQGSRGDDVIDVPSSEARGDGSDGGDESPIELPASS